MVYDKAYIGTMSTEKKSKINYLLNTHPKGTVLLSSWLLEQGYSHDLQKRYKKSGWFESIGTGALIRSGEQVDYLGGVYALQSQLGLSVHPAGKTALSLLGKTHYLEFMTKKALLFGGSGEKLPSWFKGYLWDVEVDYQMAGFLPKALGLTTLELNHFSIKISGEARAVMECLYRSPEKQSLEEIYEIMEGLNMLRPDQVQKLLEQCRSVKVKRLFLYMAEKIGHDWFDYLDLNKVDLGKGKRSLVKQGTYVDKYQITVPKILEKSRHESTI